MDKTEVEALRELRALANEIEREMMAWRGANEGIYTIRACAFAVAQKVAALNPPPPAGDTGEAVALSRADAELARTVIDILADYRNEKLDEEQAISAIAAVFAGQPAPSDAALRDKLASAIKERDEARAEADPAEKRHWHKGEPPKPQRDEWFIAETIYGDRVCLKALPEDWTYDYKTADETYIMARNIKRWMRFPDSAFIEPTAEARALAAPAESDRLRRALGSMELACERLAALRSDSTYLCMIQDPGAEEALVLLDSARKAARQALKEQTP